MSERERERKREKERERAHELSMEWGNSIDILKVVSVLYFTM